MSDFVLDTQDIRGVIPHRYPFLLVDRILEYVHKERIVGIKNVTINEPFFQGHFPEKPIMPGVLILEALAQTGSTLLLRDSEFAGRLALFAAMDKVKFRKPVSPGDQLRLEMVTHKIKEDFVRMDGIALVDGEVVCEGQFTFTLSLRPTRPQIHRTASVHASAILGKDVVIGPNVIIGENVVIGDKTIIEGHVMIEKWTQLGSDCHVHFGSVIGSGPQDIKYAGERSFVRIGDRNIIREYVTINRATGREAATVIGSDNLFLTNVHLAHNCQIGNHVTIANMTNIAGHSIIEDRALIGGMTGVHQFVRIGEGAMVGAYTRLPQDVPPFMLCEGNPAMIRTLNLIGLKRRGVPRPAIQEVRFIFNNYYRMEKNASQAIKDIEAKGIETPEGLHLLNFLKVDSPRGITKKVGKVDEDES
jgi:UDP-N-acetylglucosamine acyltransferase